MAATQYSENLHNGTNTWGHEATGLLSSKFWITCNGERIDMTTMGYPKPYITSTTAVLAVLDIMAAREARA